jgi:hypothetical protein
MDPVLISLVSALTALVASVVGPIVTVQVAKRQIAANVVSTNRHKWIAELREMLAELVSLMSAVAVMRSRWKDPWNRGMAVLDANPQLIEKIERIVLVQWKIRLLLNPSEPQSVELHDLIMSAFNRLQAETWNEAEMHVCIEEITHRSQLLLKREWRRVKEGS